MVITADVIAVSDSQRIMNLCERVKFRQFCLMSAEVEDSGIVLTPASAARVSTHGLHPPLFKSEALGCTLPLCTLADRCARVSKRLSDPHKRRTGAGELRSAVLRALSRQPLPACQKF